MVVKDVSYEVRDDQEVSDPERSLLYEGDKPREDSVEVLSGEEIARIRRRDLQGERALRRFSLGS